MQKKYKIYVRVGGLMEDPVFKWIYDGYGEGDNPYEAAENKYKNDKRYDNLHHTLWGWRIGYEDENLIVRPL
jgi:hypothetical protein